jgi:hypothetical protein
MRRFTEKASKDGMPFFKTIAIRQKTVLAEKWEGERNMVRFEQNRKEDITYNPT